MTLSSLEWFQMQAVQDHKNQQIIALSDHRYIIQTKVCYFYTAT